MRLPKMTQCIPKWTHDNNFYSSLLKGTKMCIQTDPLKGKGLFAASPMTKGEVVHQEVAQCCAQNMDDSVAQIPICPLCLRSLESVRELVVRVLGSSQAAAEVPLVRAVETPCPIACRCCDEGCSTRFCSPRCKESAWRTHHAQLCEGLMEAHQREALTEYMTYTWEQDGVDFSDTAALCLRMVAQVLCRLRSEHMTLEDAAQPYELLIHAPLDKFYFSYLLVEDDEGLDDKGLYEAFLKVKEDPSGCTGLQQFRTIGRTKAQLAEAAATMLATVFAMDETERAFFTPTRVSSYMGAALLNAQDRSTPSAYERLRDTLEYIPEVSDKVQVWEKKWLRRNSKSQASSLLTALECSSGGQGIYTIGCLFNHSCDPNLQVTYGPANDETLHVAALRDIKRGEELCISYIDESMPFVQRQRQLYKHYLFECRCPLCTKQLEAFR